MGFTYRGIGEGGFRVGSVQTGAPPTLNFDFTTGSLPGAITFTRPSIGTYNSSGNILTTAGNNVARFNYVGGVSNLLIEPSATNLLPQSNNFADAIWISFSGSVFTAAQFVSPDGANNGWSVTSGANGGPFQNSIAFSASPYTLSVWAKQITGTAPIDFYMGGLDSGNKATSPTLTRLFGTVTTPATTNNAIIQINAPTGTNGLYGAQLEIGSVMTSYIPTTTAAVTRAADSAVFTIPAGVGHLTFTFDDNTTQTVAVSAGSYTVPTNLNRPNLKSIVGSA
jgi:hypothetical protein